MFAAKTKHFDLTLTLFHSAVSTMFSLGVARLEWCIRNRTKAQIYGFFCTSPESTRLMRHATLRLASDFFFISPVY